MKKLPDIKTDFAAWYQEVVYEAELADQSPVRGCIVIRPYGNQIWENIKTYFDKRIKDTGHENALFPLLIPESFLKKEAEHVAGFAPELAIVTHAGGKELEEPLVVRPTSETIIHYMFARWIRSWRDLPLKINQWCSVVRWEMRTRPFLRTTEFYWQEGHTAHATHQEAVEEAEMMWREYVILCEKMLAVPVVPGVKSDSEKFPGAEKTLTFEGLMPDGKALQMGTSHILNQTFAHSFNMVFQDAQGKQAYPYLTSWGSTTRLIGALVMTHGDEKGLILPPKIAPIAVVIIPILKKDADNQAVLAAAEKIALELKERGIAVKLDADDHKTPGAKFYHWEMKGVPVRIEIGPRDLQNNQAMVTDRLGLEKKAVALNLLVDDVVQLLDRVQDALFDRAQKRMKAQWYKAEKLVDFKDQLKEVAGFYQVGWCRKLECELVLKEHQATIRCLIEEKHTPVCFNCDDASQGDVLVAKSY